MIPQIRLNDIPDLFLDKGRKNTAKYWVRLDFVNLYIKEQNGIEAERQIAQKG
jgi:hypothetical protein